MATISENLQTIKNSTDAIKQAIIDKGGTINGDITTWASAISGIETGGGGSSEEEYVFTGTLGYSGSKITLSGSLSSKPELSPIFLVLIHLGTGVVASKTYVSDINALTATIDTGEPLMGNEIPGICLIHLGTGTGIIFPVRFSQQSGGSAN